MKIAYIAANLVIDVNPVMVITTHPLCASEDKKGILLQQTNIFIALFRLSNMHAFSL